MLNYNEIATLGLYYYFLKKGKMRDDIKEKAMKIKNKYGWSDDEFLKICEKCYKEVMEG